MTSQNWHDPGSVPSNHRSSSSPPPPGPPSSTTHVITSPPPPSTQHSRSDSVDRSPAPTFTSPRPTEIPLATAAFTQTFSPPRVMPVPTYHEATRSSDPRVRAALHRDANRIEVPNPRAWGPPSARVFTPPAASIVEPAAPFTSPAVTQPAPLAAGVTSPTAHTDGDGWCPDFRVQRWAEGVVPIFPPHPSDDTAEPAPPPTAAVTPIPSDITERASSTDSPVRPDSRPPTPQPVTVFISDEEASEAPPASPIASQAATILPSQEKAQSVAGDTAKSVKSATRPPHGHHQRPTDVNARRGSVTDGRPPFWIGPGAPGRWWKKPPSYGFSPRYAAQRVIVYFQFPIKKDTVKQAMLDHFSKWGEVICVVPVKSINQNCEKAMVVFKDTAGARACLSDPTKDDALYRSRGLGGGMPFKLRVLPGEDESTISPVFIKVVGDRYDSAPQRTRSASPDRRDAKEGRTRHPSKPQRKPIAPRADILTTLPEKVFVDWVPKWNPHINKSWHWPRVRPLSMTKETLDRLCRHDTGKPAQSIAAIDLRSHVQEKDFIPRLCDFFGEIVDIRPCKDGSWLVEMATDGDAIALMVELRKIPGLNVQWGKDSNSRPYGGVLPPYYEDMPLTPLSRLAEYLGTPVARDGELPKEDKEEEKHGEGDRASAEIEAATERSAKTGRSRSHSVASVATSKQSAKSLRKRSASVPPEPEKVLAASAVESRPAADEPAPPDAECIEGETGSLPTFAETTQKNGTVAQHHPKTKNVPALKSLAVPVVPVDEFDPRYPHLRRRFLPTYRGRPLRHEAVNGVPRFVDDLGVFVGKLVKEKETEESIFRRFSKYGQICGIEYRPTHAITTFATARILYQTRDAVERAIAHENNRESNGSKLKVEERKVLPSDVEASLHTIKEMYLDEWDRPVSPSMASQWSPPQYAATSFPAPPPPTQEPPFSHVLPMPMPIHPQPGCRLLPVPLGFAPPASLPQTGAPTNVPCPPATFPQPPPVPMVNMPYWTPYLPHSGPPLVHSAPIQPPPVNPLFRPPMSPPTTPHNGSAASKESSPQGPHDQPPSQAGFVPMVYAMPMGIMPPALPHYPGGPAHATGPPLPLQQLQTVQAVSSPSPERVAQPLIATMPVQPNLNEKSHSPPPQSHTKPLEAPRHSGNDEKEPASQERSDAAEHNPKRSPKILRTEEHDGLLKVVYDPEDLKRWRREMGMPEDAEPPKARPYNDKVDGKEQAAGGDANIGEEVAGKVHALKLGDDETGEKGQAPSGYASASQHEGDKVESPGLDNNHERFAPVAHFVDPPHFAMSFTHTGSSWASMPPSPVPTHHGGPPEYEHPPHMPLAPHLAPHPANNMPTVPPGWDGYGYAHAHVNQSHGADGGYRAYRKTEPQRFANRVDHTHPGGRSSAPNRHPRGRQRKDSKEHGGHPAHPRHAGSQRYERPREGMERRSGHRGTEKTRREAEPGSEAKGTLTHVAVPAA